MLFDHTPKSRCVGPRRMQSGGGGLVSTTGDYLKFCTMLAGKGALGDVLLLGRKTVELMTTNHLRGDMGDMGQPRFSESSYLGFCLGFSVMLDPAKAQILGTPGEFAWSAAASTAFWVDPAEEIIVIMMTQLMPSSTYPIRKELRVLSYQAVIEEAIVGRTPVRRLSPQLVCDIGVADQLYPASAARWNSGLHRGLGESGLPQPTQKQPDRPELPSTGGVNEATAWHGESCFHPTIRRGCDAPSVRRTDPDNPRARAIADPPDTRPLHPAQAG